MSSDSAFFKQLVQSKVNSITAAVYRSEILTDEERKKFLLTIDLAADELFKVFQRELHARTYQLQDRINALEREKESALSDNLMLEYKKKDLRALMMELENAHEEVTRQSTQMREMNAQIMEKNRELEVQKEALLDQADYLHEANEAITRMHQQVEKQHQEILQKNEELQVLNQEKNNLIGIVAHDLKSPLNQVKGLVSLLKLNGDTFDADTLKLLDLIEGSINRLREMIAKILDVEAIESRSLNLAIAPVNVSTLLAEVTARFLDEAKRKSIEITCSIPDDLLIPADAGYMDQVLQNLISNAIKFSPPAKGLFISARQDNNSILIQIRDEGPGISETDMKKLFGKYQKLTARPTGNETSTGLGLSIVKKFVEAMEGQIWCESTVGNGASFFVRMQPLPVPVEGHP